MGVMVNTKTQRHKGTKKAGEQRSIDVGFLCAFVSLYYKSVTSCFFDKVLDERIPLLAKEGWREAPGWSLTHDVSERVLKHGL